MKQSEANRAIDALTRIRTRAARCLLAFVGLFACVVAHAQVPTFWGSCTGCHSTPPNIASTGTSAIGSSVYGLSESWMGSDALLKSRVNQAGVAQGNTVMTNLSLTDAGAVWNYLVQMRDGVVSSPAVAFANTVVLETRTSSFSFTISNYRDEGLSYALANSGGNAAEFTVQAHTATGTGCSPGVVPAATSTNTVSTCTVNLTVAFTPQASGSRSTDLRVTLAGASSPQPPVRTIALSAQAVLPIALSATALSPSAVVGASTTASVNVTNQSAAPVTLLGLPFSGPQQTDYSLDGSNGCSVGLALGAAQSCMLVIKFEPLSSSPTPRLATLTISHSAFGSPQTVSLSGGAVNAPLIELSAVALVFPDTPQTRNSTLTMTLRNPGSLALAFSSIGVSGAAASDFQASGTCTTLTPVLPNATCTVIVTFSPTALGPRNGSLAIASNAANAPSASVPLTGIGLAVPAPIVELTPKLLPANVAAGVDFGAQTLGGLYPPRVINLRNTGNADLLIASMSVDGATFAMTSSAPCASTLAPGANCEIRLAFSPVLANTDYAGALRISDNAAGSPHSAALLGRGVAWMVPVLAWTPSVTSLDFGMVPAGSVSGNQSLTLINQGPGGVIVKTVNAVGVDAASFAASGTCVVDQPLYEGNSCQVDVRFVPGSAGSKSAALQFASSTANTPPAFSLPAAVALGGTGLAGPDPLNLPNLAPLPTTLSFGATRTGEQSTSIDVTLSASGVGILRVTAISIDGPFALQSKTCPTLPFTLAGGSTCVVTLSFRPQAEGSAGGTLRIGTDATPSVREVALTGSGQGRPDLSSGGCSLASGDGPTDPTLWAMLVAAVAAILYRRRVRRMRSPLAPPGGRE